jgi:hypothetical protein
LRPLLEIAAARDLTRRRIAIVLTAVRIPRIVAVVAARVAVDALVIRPADAAVIVWVMQQRTVVLGRLLARVPQRLKTLRPLLIHTWAKVSDDHACVTISRPRWFLRGAPCDVRHPKWRFSVRLMLRQPRSVDTAHTMQRNLRQDTLGADMGKKISTADGGRKSGRAVFDNQGRASWEWQTATGVFQTDVTHEQMAGLEAGGLALVESESVAAHGRVWTSAPTAKVAHRANSVTAARNPTVLKRLLRRISG